MKLCLDGVRLDTTKATHHWALRLDDSRGDIYLSRQGHWYVCSPTPWANLHRWMILGPEEIIDRYAAYLSDAQKTAIAEVGGLTFA